MPAMLFVSELYRGQGLGAPANSCVLRGLHMNIGSTG